MDGQWPNHFRLSAVVHSADIFLCVGVKTTPPFVTLDKPPGFDVYVSVQFNYLRFLHHFYQLTDIKVPMKYLLTVYDIIPTCVCLDTV